MDTNRSDPLAGDDRPAAASAAGKRATADGLVPAQARDQSGRDILICVLVAIAEILLVIVGIHGVISLPIMLLVHCAIMLGVTLVLDQRERFHQDSRVLAVAVVTTAVSGPIGAALTALLGVYLRYRKLETELLAKWYERISGHTGADPVLELHERIQAGRTLNPYVDARARFAAILRSGPLDEKQRVLSIITQKYHPSFAPLLDLALRNQDPPIRVQAAAVAARLKEHERVKLKDTLARATASLDDGAQVDLAREISAAIGSGLLDEQDAAVARSQARELLSDAIHREIDVDAASLLLAELLARDEDHLGAASVLEPLAARGVTQADAPLHDALVRLRRYSDAARIRPRLEAAKAGDGPTSRDKVAARLGDAA